MIQNIQANAAGTIRLGDLTVNRLGFGAMRITGKGIWGPPENREGAIATSTSRRSNTTAGCAVRTMAT